MRAINPRHWCSTDCKKTAWPDSLFCRMPASNANTSSVRSSNDRGSTAKSARGALRRICSPFFVRISTTVEFFTAVAINDLKRDPILRSAEPHRTHLQSMYLNVRQKEISQNMRARNPSISCYSLYINIRVVDKKILDLFELANDAERNISCPIFLLS